jgi:hypothetical protein
VRKLENWLQDWWIPINVSNSTAVLFAETARSIQMQFFGVPIQMAETTRYLAMTLGRHLAWWIHVNQLIRKAVQRLGVLAPSLTEVSRPLEIVCCSQHNSSVLRWIVCAPSVGPLLAAVSGSCKCCNPIVFALRLTRFGSLVMANSRELWDFIYSDHITALTESFDSNADECCSNAA